MPLLLLLAACGQQAPQPTNETKTAAPAAGPAPTSAKPFTHDQSNDLIDFHYAWPSEVAALPQLAAEFRKKMEDVNAGAIDNAKKGKAADEKGGFEYRKHSYSSDFEAAGQSARLLSLREEFAAYTGGAHGNFGTRAALWDRQANKYQNFASLFAAAANMDRLLTQRWCDALNKARKEKREEPVSGTGMFDECPKLDEISIIPTDKNRNGKFERLVLVADPYVAGPYVEGSYEIELPVTADLIAVLKADYRESFEVQPQ